MTLRPLILLAALGFMPAAASAHPNILPVRDVAVSYRLDAPGRPPADYQFSYDAADQRARIDDPARGTYFLVDLPAGQARLVIPALHTVVEAPNLSTISQEITQLKGARFTNLGQASYAGGACDKYLVLSNQGSADVCLTPDGVALSFHGHDAHGSATVTATSVAYGPQPAGQFIPPAGFGSVTLPPQALAALLRQQ